MPRGLCRLCQVDAELQLSHILPAFSYRWLRKSSGNSLLRETTEPDLRVQDGRREYLLCGSCEALFSRWETDFANKLFYPYTQEPQGQFHYSKWLLNFCVSVSWRVLSFYTGNDYLRELQPAETSFVSSAEVTWREFLLGQRPHPGFFRQHLLPLGMIEPTNVKVAQNVNRYFMCTSRMDMLRGRSGEIFTLAKIGPIIIVGMIFEPNQHHWRGTKIATKGTIMPQKYRVPRGLMEYMNNDARQLVDVHNKISANQKAKIEQSRRASGNKFVGSIAYKALEADIRLSR